MKPVGTCGECGGPVCFPEMWGGTQLPPVTCQNCDMRMKASHGPVVEMEERTDTGKNYLHNFPETISKKEGAG